MKEAIFLPLVSVMCFSLGLFVYLKPLSAIEIQRKFYEKINWKIEPISLEKEIRNTRFMGLFLIYFVIFTLAYLKSQK